MSQEEGLSSCKVVLLGESGVGKTCIISRFINNIFDDNSISTNGASYAGKSMDFPDYGKSIKFEIWDTAGQEKYRALTRIFYKDAAAAILVYDITRKESFEEIKNYWYGQIIDYAPKEIVIGIAANKSDLFDREQVTEEEAREYAKSIGAIFRLTSAMTAGGIEDLFDCVGKKYLDPSFIDDGKSHLPSKKTPQKTKSNSSSGGKGIVLDPSKSTSKKDSNKKCC